MPLILWVAKNQHASSTTPPSPYQKRERKRLQKAPRHHDSYQEMKPSQFPDPLDTSAPPAYCLAVSIQDEKAALAPTLQHPAHATRHTKIHPVDSPILDRDDIFIAELESPSTISRRNSTTTTSNRNSLRTRSKTPVFAIGQLEQRLSSARTPFIPLPVALEDAESLAQEYQSILPLRAITPFITNVICEYPKRPPQARRRTLRKIKSQHSLRSLASFAPAASALSCSSDTETLVGLESPLASPGIYKSQRKGSGEPWVHALDTDSGHDESRDSSRPSTGSTHSSFDMPTPLNFSRRESQVGHDPEPATSSPPASAAADDDVGLNICLNLLTDELATAFLRQHPTERGDHTSGLQILLMIEAYEAVQKQLREQMERNQRSDRGEVRPGREDVDVNVLEDVLDQWLEALYTLYEARKGADAFEA